MAYMDVFVRYSSITIGIEAFEVVELLVAVVVGHESV